MKLNRRHFLKKTLAAGSLMTGVGPLISSCSGVRRSDTLEHYADEDAPLWLDRVSQKILHYASLAPSGHNSQPWFVRVKNQNEWIIGADPKRRMPTVDPANREVMLSIGAFAENLDIAASYYGLKANMDVIAKDPFDTEILKVSLRETAPVRYPLQRITSRMTVKHGYQPDEIRSEDVLALSGPLNGHLHYFPRGTRHADCMVEGAIENFKLQVARDVAQVETVHWMRLSNREALQHRDGLTAEGMEIKGFKGWVVRNFLEPEDFMKPSFRQQSVDHTAKLARQGGGWFVITSDGRTVADLIETGRRFQKMALLARERNIAIHPMTQHLEEESGTTQIAAHHQASMTPQFMLRVGYLNRYPEPVSLRRPVSWFVR